MKLSPFNASLLLVPGYVLGGIMAPFAGRVADKTGARGPASAGVLVSIISLGIFYLLLGTNTSTWVVIIGTMVNGVGSAFFYPANSSAVMANAEQEIYGVASGLLRTFANIGLTASIAVAMVGAASSIPRDQAFAIFLGTSSLSTTSSGAFMKGLHTAFVVSMAFLVVTFVLSLIRGKENRSR